VGAVTLSRAVSDPDLSAQILDGALSGVLAMLSHERDADEESAA
jgi:TetR/AcrR family transcriptional repressor of nem operon